MLIQRALMALPRQPLKGKQLRYNVPVIFYMLVVHVLAVVALLPWFWTWRAFVAFGVLYWVTVIGITLGFHRMASHKSLAVPKWLERTLITMGSLAAQDGPIQWVGLHRHHHRYSDQPNDHHDSKRGFWWAHSGWMLRYVPASRHVANMAKDLAKDPYYRWLDKWFLYLQAPLAVALYFWGGWAAVLWGVPLRLCVVYHVTWLVNSATHTFGYRNFNSPDLSRNCWWVALLSFGEGWHNNHHANQASARHGLRWFEFDFTWQHIRFLTLLGLTKKVQPSPKLP